MCSDHVMVCADAVIVDMPYMSVSSMILSARRLIGEVNFSMA